MMEYIIEWSGIGARIVELIGSVPACLITKRIREERLREEIVRCMDCNWLTNSSHYGAYCTNFGAPLHDDYDGFCAWAERKEGGDD